MIYIAYFALLIGAIIPIYIGSYASTHKKNKSSKETESLSTEDAMWFPVMGSCTLFGLYLLFKYFGKEYINYLLTGYFAVLGTGALSQSMHQVMAAVGVVGLLGSVNQSYKLTLKNSLSKKKLFKLEFDNLLILLTILSTVFTGYYVYTKHWVLSNVFGEAFSISAIQLLELDDFKTGIILLSGLFFYDIFWVFGTEVMVSVAKQFDAPVKLLFPKDLWADELQFTMLGLGDIVIPGIFIALCLRFDVHKKLKGRPYFTASLVSYVIGLVTTVYVMHTFKAAQPALLYLSPACILSVLIVGVVRGELSDVFAYKNNGTVEGDKKEVEKKKK